MNLYNKNITKINITKIENGWLLEVDQYLPFYCKEIQDAIARIELYTIPDHIKPKLLKGGG